MRDQIEKQRHRRTVLDLTQQVEHRHSIRLALANAFGDGTSALERTAGFQPGGQADQGNIRRDRRSASSTSDRGQLGATELASRPRIASSSAVKSGRRRSADGAEASSRAQAESPSALLRAANRRTRRPRIADRHIRRSPGLGCGESGESVCQDRRAHAPRRPTRSGAGDAGRSRPGRGRAACWQRQARQRAEAGGPCTRAEHEPTHRSREQPAR